MDIHISIKQEAKNTKLGVHYILELESIAESVKHCNLGLERTVGQEVYYNLVQEYIVMVKIQNSNIKVHYNPFSLFYCPSLHLT